MLHCCEVCKVLRTNVTSALFTLCLGPYDLVLHRNGASDYISLPLHIFCQPLSESHKLVNIDTSVVAIPILAKGSPVLVLPPVPPPCLREASKVHSIGAGCGWMLDSPLVCMARHL